MVDDGLASPRVEKKRKDGATQLVGQLIRMGYLHGAHSKASSPMEIGDDIESFRKFEKDPPQSFSADIKCDIIPSLDRARYYTAKGLVTALVRELEKLGGRHPLDGLAKLVNVDSTYLQGRSPLFAKLPCAVRRLGTDLISDSFWAHLTTQIQGQLDEQGSIAILDLATQNSLPIENLLHHCVDKLRNAELIGGKTLASQKHLEELKSTVIHTFRQFEEPVHVSTICQHHQWDFAVVLGWLSNLDRAGELRVDPNNTAMAMYLPTSYTDKQQQEIIDFASVNGYITAGRAAAQGMSMSQVTTLVGEKFPGAIQLKDVLVLPFILQNVQVAIQEMSSVGILYMKEYLSAELAEGDILRGLLKHAGFDRGVHLLAGEHALLVSNNLITEISQNVLAPLIESYAKETAREIHNSSESISYEEEEPRETSNRKRRSKPRKRKTGRSTNLRTANSGVVPLVQVAHAIMSSYPELSIEPEGNDLMDQATISWNDESDSGIVAVEFCKHVVYTSLFRSKCDKAVEAELQRLKSTMISKSTLSRKDAAAKVRVVETSFEEAFITCCHVIQASVKFCSIASASKRFDSTTLGMLEQELLQGACADLTSRITQFCLFKNEEESVFSFQLPDETDTKEQDSSTLPEFCRPVDVATRIYKPMFLSCPPPREPLPILRESLTGNIGVMLARQWILCGGECYRGGIRVDETDGATYVRPGNLDGFLRHAEENCLTMCGIPFKRMDKKSEKQFFFRRRQALTALLQSASDPTQILDLTLMILFQQLRQVSASGSLLRGPILEMLLDERKIKGEVAAALKALNEKINSGGLINDDLITAVKDCGLSRDVSKHEVPALECFTDGNRPECA